MGEPSICPGPGQKWDLKMVIFISIIIIISGEGGWLQVTMPLTACTQFPNPSIHFILLRWGSCPSISCSSGQAHWAKLRCTPPGQWKDPAHLLFPTYLKGVFWGGLSPRPRAALPTVGSPIPMPMPMRLSTRLQYRRRPPGAAVASGAAPRAQAPPRCRAGGSAAAGQRGRGTIASGRGGRDGAPQDEPASRPRQPLL